MVYANNQHDFLELVGRYFDGELTGEQWTWLNVQLREDSQKRRTFVRFCWQAKLISESALCGDSAMAASLDDVEAVPTPAVAVNPLHEHGGGIQQSLFGHLPEGVLFSYVVATVLFSLVLLGGSYITISRFTQTPQQPHNPSIVSLTEGQIGRVTALADCRGRRWSVADGRWSEIINHQTISQGDHFQLSYGLMEIAYDTGAKVILEGPCAYKIDSDRGGFLAVGKLTAKVEKKADVANHSPLSPLPSPLFAVRTPTAVVTDLGTEFGVEVETNGSTRSHVFQGSVELRTSKKQNSTSSDDTPAEILRAGQSARVERGRNNNVSIILEPRQSSRFIRFIPKAQSQITRSIPASPPRMSSEAYAKHVLSLKPAVYYRMERPASQEDRSVVFDSASGGYHGTFHTKGTPVSPYAAGRFGDAMVFRGAIAGDYMVLPECPIDAHGPMTFAAWVLADSRPDWATILAYWGRHTDGKSLVAPIHFALYPPAHELCLDVQSRDSGHSFVAEGESPGEMPFPLHCWQHVVFVIDAGRDEAVLRLYRNGMEYKSRPFNAVDPRAKEPVWVLGGAALKVGGAMHSWNTSSPLFGWKGDVPMPIRIPMTQLYWQGRIDEVAIFNEALSPDTIERLYLGGTAAAKGDDAMTEP